MTESAIDALSIATLKKNPFDSYCLSLGGVYTSKDEKTAFKTPKALVSFLDNNSDISHITLCLDKDDTGHEASKVIAHRLVETGYIVINKPPRNYKDYNEYLQKTNSYVKNNQITY